MIITEKNTNKEHKIEYIVRDRDDLNRERLESDFNILRDKIAKFIETVNGPYTELIEYLKRDIYNDYVEATKNYDPKYNFYALYVDDMEVISRNSIKAYIDEKVTKEVEALRARLMAETLNNFEYDFFKPETGKDVKFGVKNIEEQFSMNPYDYVKEFKNFMKMFKKFVDNNKVKVVMTDNMYKLYKDNFYVAACLFNDFDRAVNIDRYPAWEHSYGKVREKILALQKTVKDENTMNVKFNCCGVTVTADYDGTTLKIDGIVK